MNLPAHKKMLAAAAAASVMLLTAACGSSDESDASSSSTATSAAPTTEAPAADATTDAPTEDTPDIGEADAGAYADGDYSAEGSYSNPGGESTVKVDLTISDGTISDVTVTPEAENGTSKQYQEKFAGGIADEVVGKSLDDLDVTKVAGSSLTSGGFNEAIEQIKSDAQAEG
jgi:major membrane immunogen (membrane-anchored lipoprotein)